MEESYFTKSMDELNYEFYKFHTETEGQYIRLADEPLTFLERKAHNFERIGSTKNQAYLSSRDSSNHSMCSCHFKMHFLETLSNKHKNISTLIFGSLIDQMVHSYHNRVHNKFNQILLMPKIENCGWLGCYHPQGFTKLDNHLPIFENKYISHEHMQKISKSGIIFLKDSFKYLIKNSAGATNMFNGWEEKISNAMQEFDPAIRLIIKESIDKSS
jgi:hypothetical protein